MSLEEQLAAIQKQLLAISKVPAAIQQTLDVITQQLTKIVVPVNDPNVENEDNEGYTLENTEGETEKRTAELETLEEISEGDFETDSYQGDRKEDGEKEGDQEDDHEKELEMLHPTPEAEELLTPEVREQRSMEQEKMDKKQKIVHWNNIWPWGDHLGRRIYRDSNTHLVESKVIETKKINFLKYQPPPETLAKLKHSEINRLVHDIGPPTRGVQFRQGNATTDEDYYAQIQKSSQEGVAQQTKVDLFD